MKFTTHFQEDKNVLRFTSIPLAFTALDWAQCGTWQRSFGFQKARGISKPAE
jgi:hypothetical protein